jgi:hypothetical protein
LPDLKIKNIKEFIKIKLAKKKRNKEKKMPGENFPVK